MLQRLLFLTVALSVACGDDSSPNKANNANNANNPNNTSNNTNASNNAQPTNNPIPARNAEATIEIVEGDFEQPLAFSTTLPTGTYASRSDDVYLLNLTLQTVSEDPEISISLTFADPNKPVESGVYEVVVFPDLVELDVFGSMSITGDAYFGTGKFQTGSARLTKVNDGPVSGTKLVSGTFSVEGILDWSNGKEGQSDFNIQSGTFTDVPVTILP